MDLRDVIREVNIKHSALDYIRYQQLNWYGYVQRMDQERLPRRFLEWCLPGRRRKRRPRNSWMQEVTTGTREGNWRLGMGRQRRVEKKNKTLGT